MPSTSDVRRVLLISNSTLHGSGYLDHSTGMALQDVAVAAFLYEKALRQESGVRLNFAA